MRRFRRSKFPGTSGGRRTLFDGAVNTCMHAASAAACDHSRPDRVLPVTVACSGQLCSCTYLRHGRVALHKRQLRIKRLGPMAAALEDFHGGSRNLLVYGARHVCASPPPLTLPVLGELLNRVNEGVRGSALPSWTFCTRMVFFPPR